jgi:hypothetical protein
MKRGGFVFTLVAAMLTLCGAARAADPLWLPSSSSHVALDCAEANAMCTETGDWRGTFPYYVGHDEPSVIFYSSQPGSGYQMSYGLVLPKDPGNPSVYSTASTANTYNFELHPAFWFGMAMCDTQSYPQQNLSTCHPDSDANITPDTYAGLASHAGTAFMEMQFYPPGYTHQPVNVSPCATGQSPGDNEWCAALNIDSLSEDPVNGTELNSSCQSVVGSPEYVNFAIVTTNGKAAGPANPVDSTQATYDGGTNTFFMHSGDRLRITFNDIPDTEPGTNGSGLRVVIDDLTTGTSGSMVASGTGPSNNGFGMVQYAPGTGPHASNNCNAIPYNFHPMYNTASPQGRVIWAAHTYNIAFSDEIGHWDFCNPAPLVPLVAACNPAGLPGFTEGVPGDKEPSDSDDLVCEPPAAPGALPVSGCIGINGGYDGASYKNDWPTSETPSATVPTPIAFTSPVTGGATAAQDRIPYSDVAFEADLPRIEGNDLPGTRNNCQRLLIGPTGTTNPNAGFGCYRVPLTDESGVPKPGTTFTTAFADRYPWFDAFTPFAGGLCAWQEGAIAGNGTTIEDFGANNQYGGLYPVTYLAGNGSTPSNGHTIVNLEDFHNDLGTQPCRARK